MRGNADRLVLARGRRARAWCDDRLDADARAFLAVLPTTVSWRGSVLSRLAAERRRDPDGRDSGRRGRRRLAGVTEELVVCGHTHVQFDRIGGTAGECRERRPPLRGRGGGPSGAARDRRVEFVRRTTTSTPPPGNWRSRLPRGRRLHTESLLDPDPDDVSRTSSDAAWLVATCTRRAGASARGERSSRSSGSSPRSIRTRRSRFGSGATWSSSSRSSSPRRRPT